MASHFIVPLLPQPLHMHTIVIASRDTFLPKKVYFKKENERKPKTDILLVNNSILNFQDSI